MSLVERAKAPAEQGHPFEFTVPGEPITQGSIRPAITKAGQLYTIHDNRKTLTAWRKVAQQAALTGKAKATTKFFDVGVPVIVSAAFICTKPKVPTFSYPTKDLDKLARALLDALTGVVIADDSQVVELRVRKLYGLEPRTRVIVAHV
jgi:crossover junction endodeoxyribonuclease RusA